MSATESNENKMATYNDYMPAENEKIEVLYEQLIYNFPAKICKVTVQIQTAMCNPGKLGWLHINFNRFFQTGSTGLRGMSEWNVISEEQKELSVKHCNDLWNNKEIVISLGGEEVSLKKKTKQRNFNTKKLVYGSVALDGICKPAYGWRQGGVIYRSKTNNKSQKITGEAIKASIEVVTYHEEASLVTQNETLLIIPGIGMRKKLNATNDVFHEIGEPHLKLHKVTILELQGLCDLASQLLNSM